MQIFNINNRICNNHQIKGNIGQKYFKCTSLCMLHLECHVPMYQYQNVARLFSKNTPQQVNANNHMTQTANRYKQNREPTLCRLLKDLELKSHSAGVIPKGDLSLLGNCKDQHHHCL